MTYYKGLIEKYEKLTNLFITLTIMMTILMFILVLNGVI